MIDKIGKIIANMMLIAIPLSVIIMIWISIKVGLTVFVVDISIIFIVIALYGSVDEKDVEQ